jgi:transposase
MEPTTPHRVEQQTACAPTLFLAFELGVNKWTLGFTTGVAQRPRERQVPAGDCQCVLEEIQRATQRFGLPQGARVVSCYEAGRAGFWVRRFLATHGVENCVVDSASIEVHRRHRRAKTER